MARVIRIEFKAAHKAFNQLRGNNDRGLIWAYRFGEIMKVLNKQGFTLEELGEEFDRRPRTISLYIKLFNSYADEQELLQVAGQMKTWSVSRLTGNAPLISTVFVFHCANCGAKGEDIIKERKPKAEVEADKAAATAVGAPSVKFEQPHYQTGTDN